MKQNSETEKIIATLIETTFAQPLSGREKHLFKESLHSLVRLAKAEQMLEMRMNVEKLTGIPGLSRLKEKKLPGSSTSKEISQQQLEFSEPDFIESPGQIKNR